MADINENKLRMMVEFLEQQEGQPVNKVDLCKVTGLNHRYKSYEKYLAQVRKDLPDLTINFYEEGQEPPAAIAPVEPTEPTQDDELDKMLGEDEPAPEAPSNPAPSNPAPSNPAPSNPAPSNPAPSNPAPSNPAPSNPAPEVAPITYELINDKNILVPLDVKMVKGNRMVFTIARDEVVNVNIQGNVIEINISDLIKEGRQAEADFYRTQAV